MKIGMPLKVSQTKILQILVVSMGMILSYQNCSRKYDINGSGDIGSLDPFNPQNCKDESGQPCDPNPNGGGGGGGDDKSKNQASGTITIDSDRAFTNNKDLKVSLTLNSQSATEMYITNNSDCKEGGEWEPYKTSKAWKLDKGNSLAKVFVRFRETPQDQDPLCTSDSIAHDSEPPVQSVEMAPPKFTNKTSLKIVVKADDSLSGLDHFECLDAQGKSTGPCDPIMNLSGLQEGIGQVSIIAFDKAGNQSSANLLDWTVDLTPPLIKINSMPSAVTNMANSQVAFSVTDNFSKKNSSECNLDSKGFVPCTSPHSMNVIEGNHTLIIRAIDEAGNISLPVDVNWLLDITVPTVMITSMPGPFSNIVDPTFTFEGKDGNSPLKKFECSVDGSVFKPCTSPMKLSPLGEGAHKFSVVGIDDAGNKSAPSEYMWSVDLTRPMVQIISGPLANSKNLEANFTFIATDNLGVERIECSLDGGSFSTCSSPVALKNLTEGDHVFAVRALDKAQNTSIPATYSWIIDITLPTVKILSGPPSLTKDTSASFSLLASDAGGIDKILCRIDNGTSSPCGMTVSFNSLGDGPHTFYVKATDAAGNTSAEVSYTWTVDTQGPSINFTKIPMSILGQTDTAEVEFTVTDAYAGVNTVSCGLQGNQVSCPSTKIEAFFNQNPDKTYTYIVTASDKLGNESTNSVKWDVKKNTMEVIQNVEVKSYNKADILIVIDNSGSMATEQANMAARFATFVDSLKDLDWQLSIVTTDLSMDAVNRDGRLVQFNATGTAIPTGTFILKSSMNKVDTKLAFGQTIQQSTYGSGYEQGIGATYRSIQRFLDKANAVNTPNWNFFRDGASLSVVVVTDANETPSAGTLAHNIPENLFNLVKGTFPGKTFTFHSIIVKSGDSACLAINGNESYGVSYETLSNLTGGVIGSVCAADYGSQLSAIGKVVIDSVRRATLQCTPLDLNKDGKADLTVKLADNSTPPSFTVTGMTLDFATSLPVGIHQVTYTCLKP